MICKFFKSFGKKSTPETPEKSTMERMEKTKIAQALSAQFEGPEVWSNITGNFDGCGLTCGSLGWIMQDDNQDALVFEFVEKHGEARGRELMPQKWQEYLDVIRDPASTAMVIVRSWSDRRRQVIDPYKSELKAFWESPEMVEIQVKHADAVMGAFADKNANAFCAIYEIPFTQKIFNWFFDIAVHNGSMKSVGLSEGSHFQFSDLERWTSSLSVPSDFQNTLDDLNENIKLWKPMFDNLMAFEKNLVGLSMYRSMLSKTEFQADVMNRKGTIAFGKGIVHGDKYELQ